MRHFRPSVQSLLLPELLSQLAVDSPPNAIGEPLRGEQGFGRVLVATGGQNATEAKPEGLKRILTLATASGAAVGPKKVTKFDDYSCSQRIL